MLKIRCESRSRRQIKRKENNNNREKESVPLIESQCRVDLVHLMVSLFVLPFDGHEHSFLTT